MKIKSVRIKNFKSIVDETYEFDDRFTLIIGDNGTGKTTILEALSIGLGGFLAGLDGVETRNFSKEEIRREREKVGDATVTHHPQVPVEVECVGYLAEGNPFSWTRAKRTINGRTTRSEAREMIERARGMQHLIVKERNPNILLPLISYQSAGRLFSQKKHMWVDPFKKEELSRFLGYTHCLDAESDIKQFGNWLRRMTSIQLQKRKQIGELDAVLGAVEEFLSGLVEEGQGATLHYDFEDEEIIVELGDIVLPLRLMSAGYRSVIGMVADLAYRMALLNPQLKERAVKETPGVVLIDELDLHLHPKWQWRIVEDLKRTFPNVQFIATTHAPIIISSCKDGMLIRLVEDGEDIEPVQERAKYGWLVEDILRTSMGSFVREPHVEKEIREIKQLYMKKMHQELSEQELAMLHDKTDLLLSLLPQGDPAVTLARIEAIGKAAGGHSDDTSYENR